MSKEKQRKDEIANKKGIKNDNTGAKRQAEENGRGQRKRKVIENEGKDGRSTGRGRKKIGDVRKRQVM